MLTETTVEQGFSSKYPNSFSIPLQRPDVQIIHSCDFHHLILTSLILYFHINQGTSFLGLKN